MITPRTATRMLNTAGQLAFKRRFSQRSPVKSALATTAVGEQAFQQHPPATGTKGVPKGVPFVESDMKIIREKLTHLPENAVQFQWPKDKPVNKEAAVLVPLINYQGEAAVLFTVRSSALRDHQGEVSFPGGKREGDETLEQTALRETFEEILVPSANIQVLGAFAAVPNKTNTIKVTPIVGFLGDIDPKQITFNNDEVASVFALSLRQLRDPALQSYRQFRNTKFKYLVYNGGPAEVWGLTAFILEGVLSHVIPPVLSSSSLS